VVDGRTAFIVSAALAAVLLAFMLWRGIYNRNRDGNL
jgi:membrane protein involved in colicin uptake